MQLQIVANLTPEPFGLSALSFQERQHELALTTGDETGVGGARASKTSSAD